MASKLTETKAEQEAAKTIEELMEEYVEYTAPYAADVNDSTPIFAAVNGETLRIQRGETVRVKRKYIEVLRNAEAQERAYRQYQRMAQQASKRALADL